MTLQEKKIKTLFIAVYLLFGVLITIFVSLMFYNSLQSLHNKVFSEYKDVYVKNSNEEAKRVVDYFIDSIKYKENNLLISYKEKLKRKCETGYNIAAFFYDRFDDKLTNKQLKSVILEALQQADKNYVVIDGEGKIVLSPYFNKGFDMSKFKDAFGNRTFDIIKQDIRNSKNAESFIFCYMDKKHKNKPSMCNSSFLLKRIVYAKYFKPLGWYIISSVLYKDIDRKLQKSIENEIERFRYGTHKKNYVFVLKIIIENKGLKVKRIVNPNLPKKLIGTFVPLNIKDISGRMFLRDMLRVAFTKGEGFVYYKFRVPLSKKTLEKTTFVKYYPKWHWLVCSGYYPSVFYADLHKKDEQLKSFIIENVKKLTVWLIVFEAFLFVILLFFIARIMERIKVYREELESREKFSKHLVESVPNPLFILDKNGEFIGVNRAFVEFFLCETKELCSKNEDPDIMLVKDKAMEYLRKIDQTNPKEFNIVDDEGKLRFIELYNSAFYDLNSEVAGVVGVLFDVTKSRIAEMELRQISIKDELTGLYNRRYFNQVLPREIERAKRYDNPLSFIMYDIDHFKKVNDNFGHQAGDMVLKTISDIVLKNIRNVDFVFRIGGEEFVILLIETDKKDAYIVAEKIRRIVEQYDFGNVGSVTISLGVTGLRKSDTLSRIMKRIDDALYQSKNSGRNRTTVL